MNEVSCTVKRPRFGQRHALESAKRSSPEKLVWLIIKRKSCLYVSGREILESKSYLSLSVGNHYLKQSIHKIACKSIYQKPSYELSAVINPNHIIIFCQIDFRNLLMLRILDPNVTLNNRNKLNLL
uniref:Uncharacterized protein n=1 Tax=Rhizophagus irregularis (strain DAOM 181602 / DAOM 197198 / MUCL 43194) TaxID=747089 RepID=U9T045_RHIID